MSGRSSNSSNVTSLRLVKYSDEIEAKMPPMLTYDTMSALISMNRSASDESVTNDMLKKRIAIATAS